MGGKEERHKQSEIIHVPVPLPLLLAPRHEFQKGTGAVS